MSRTRRVCATLSALALLAAISLWPADTRAQPRKPRPPIDVDGPVVEEQTFDGLTIPKDREATAIINAAKEYVVKKDWDTVARSLQFLLEKPEDSFFEVTRKDEKGKDYVARVSIRIEANRLIGELPPEGLETYRQKYGQRAMLLLQEGKDKNDPAILSLVALRFRHTEAGVKAIQLLGNYFLDRGNYQLASGKFQELLELLDHEKPEVKKEIGPPTFFKAALAYQRFGDAQMADKLWKQVAELAGEKGITIAGKLYALKDLRAEFDRNAQVGAKTLASFQVIRGDASHTAQGVGGTPFLEPEWSASMFVPDKDKGKDSDEQDWLKTAEWVQDKIRSATDMMEKGSGKRALLPGFFPVAGNNRLIFRTYDGVYAYYLRNDEAMGARAGTLAWMQPTEGSLHSMGYDRKGTAGRGTFEGWWGQFYGSMGNGMSLPGILFENSSVGTLSHDNKFVYYVDDLAMPPHPNQTMYGFNGSAAPFGAFTDQVLFSSLRAVELDTGLLKWEIGERKQGGKIPVIQPGGGIRQIRRPDGKIIQIGPDGKEIEIDPKTGQPVKKTEPEKPFVLPKDLPETKGFVNAADELMDTYFLGPPLPVGGKIYVLVEYNGEIQLCCINPNRLENRKASKQPHEQGPELVWRQPLGTANLKLMQDTMRRIQPCHLAYNDGILICPTNAGALIGVNLLTQSLAWAYSYRTGPAEGAPEGSVPPGAMPGMGRGGRFRPDMMMHNMAAERWAPAPPAIVNGLVVFTAPDSNQLICLSVRDGKRHWAVNRQPGDLYMAGVYDGKVLVVAKDSIRALKLADGSLAWDRPKPIGMPSGQGVASNGKYFLPCRNGVDSPDPQIVEVDIATGDMHATKSRKKEIPGNLMFFDGDVISQSIWSVSAYPQLHVKLAEMNARLAKNPNDPQGLTDRGELHLDKGELVLAVTDLKAALEFKPQPEIRAKARLKLYDALTELLQKDFDKGEVHLSVYKDLCLNEVAGDEKQKRQSAYLCILGKGRENQGKLTEAFDAYMEFGQLNGAREMVPSVDEPGTLARPDVWARGRILAMIAKARPEDKKPLEERIAKQWAEVKAGGDLDKIKGFVQLFGSMFSSGMEARLMLAERLMTSTSQDDQRQAELYLDMLRRQHDNIGLAAQATETLARFMVKKGLLRDAVLLYRVLGTEFKDVKLADGRTGADIYNELVTDKRFLPYLEAGFQIWTGAKLHGEQVQGPFQNIMQAYFTVEPDGELLPFFHQHRLVIDTQTPSGNGMWQIRLVDRASGETKWKQGNLTPNHFLINQGYTGPNMTSTGGPRFAQVHGHILMLTMAHMVYAWDLSDQKKLWEVNLLGKNPNAQITDTRTDADGTIRLLYADGSKIRIGQMGILESSYVCLPTRDGLTAMDPATGTVLWKREAGSGAHLFGDAEYIFVVDVADDGNPTSTLAVRAADGVSVKVKDFASLYHPARRIATLGRNLLVFDDDKGGKALRLYDVLTGQDVWKQSYPEGTKVIRSQERGLAGVVQPDGALTLLDTTNGKPLLQTKEADDRVLAEHLNNVHDLILLQDRERFYVALNKPAEAGIQAYPFVSNGLRSLRVHGTLYAYDKAGGHLDWYRDDIANEFLILEHFDELPILILGTMVNRANQAQSAKVEAIDKKSGKLIFDKPVANNGQFYAMTADVKTGIVELLRYDLKIRFAPEGAVKAEEGGGNPVGAGGPGVPIPFNGPVGAMPPPVLLRGNIRLAPAQRIQIQIQAAPRVEAVAPPKEKPADTKPLTDKPVDKPAPEKK